MILPGRHRLLPGPSAKRPRQAARAALFAAYSPPEGAAPAPSGGPHGPDAVAEVLDRAVDHGDEHVIKFTDTAAEVYARTGHPGALAAALHAGTLLPRPGG